MYNQEDSFVVAVLTQERLMRLLKKNPKLTFDANVKEIFTKDFTEILSSGNG